LKNHPQVFYFSLILTLGETLFPVWFFLGIERMRYIAIINIITRILSAVLIFIFVKQAGDYMKVPLMLGLGTILGAIIGLFIVFRKYHNNYILYPVKELRIILKENVPLFISNVSSQIYVNANKLIVGSFLGMQDVAVYDIADKIVSLLKVPVQLIGQTLFPRVAHDKDVSFVKKSMIYVFVFLALIYTGVFIYSGQLIHLFSGSTYANATILLRILAVSILPICLSMFLAELLLIPFGKLKDYARMRTVSLFVYLIITGTLFKLKLISLNNLGYTIVIVESFVSLYSYYLCKKSKLF
jgi:PST family polysaccharide transporter